MNKLHHFYRMYLPLPVIAARRSARDAANSMEFWATWRPLMSQAEAVLGQVLMADEGSEDTTREALSLPVLFKWVIEQTAAIKKASTPLYDAQVWCKYQQAVISKQLATLEVLLRGLEKLSTLYLGSKNRIEDAELVQLIDITGFTLLQDALDADNQRIQAYINYSRDTNPKRYEQEAQMAINNSNIHILQAYSDALAGNFEGLRTIALGEQDELANAEACLDKADVHVQPYYERLERLARRSHIKEQIKLALQNLAAGRTEMTQAIQLTRSALSLQQRWLASKRNQLTGISNKQEARLQLKYISQQLYMLAFRRTELADKNFKNLQRANSHLSKVY